MTQLSLTDLESEVLKLLLSGEEPILILLRKQLASTISMTRIMTGHGFFLNFEVPSTVEKVHEHLDVKSDFCFGDVKASIKSLKAGAGFLLWIKQGILSCLEGYTYEEQWPNEIETFQVRYFGSDDRNWDDLRNQWKK